MDGFSIFTGVLFTVIAAVVLFFVIGLTSLTNHNDIAAQCERHGFFDWDDATYDCKLRAP